jgi:hypothetical protein
MSGFAVRSARAKDFSARCQVVVAVKIKQCGCLIKTLWLLALQKNMLASGYQKKAALYVPPNHLYHTHQATW